MSSTQETPRKTRVLVFAPSFPPAYLGGGPARTLSALVAATPPEFEVFVVTPDRDADGSLLEVTSNVWTVVGQSRVYYANTANLSGFRGMLLATRSVRPDLIYLNSFFSAKYSIIPALLARLCFWGTADLLIAPRGEFDAGALGIRKQKKYTFIACAKLLRIYAHASWHASAAMEAEAIHRVWGWNVEVLIRENETALPKKATPPVFLQPSKIRAAFLSRISPKKGLLIALKALQASSCEMTLDIYGPEEDKNYSAECRRAAGLLPAHIQSTFHGAISPESTRSLLSSHDVLILPTAGENFGHVIAEALSASCPVMCPNTTPWSEVLRAGGGWVIEPNTASAWAKAIDLLQEMHPTELSARRYAAGDAYNAWKTKTQPPHIFALYNEALAHQVQ